MFTKSKLSFYTHCALVLNVSLVWFGLVCLSSISSIVGYLMPNPVFTYIIYDLQTLFVDAHS